MNEEKELRMNLDFTARLCRVYATNVSELIEVGAESVAYRNYEDLKEQIRHMGELLDSYKSLPLPFETPKKVA